MASITFLIKPASSSCNLRCNYCFNLSQAEQRSIHSYGMMSEETLESIVKKGLEYADDGCAFAFQGGEPTLVGLGFYKRFTEFEKQYNIHNVKISNSIQTNGTLIDEDWARFLHDNNFLVGLSLDGDSKVHNLHRTSPEGKGSFNRVMKTAKLFDSLNVKYNILTVVTSNTSRRAERIYNFFKRNRFGYIQFINCLDPLGEEPGRQSYSLKPHYLERFLKSLFDLWYNDLINGEYVSIRYFDNLVRILLGQSAEACNMNGICTCNCVIESDGSMYPCDFYMLDEWRLGSIITDSIDEILQNNKAKEFILSSAKKNQTCTDCRWNFLCRGGCRRERVVLNNNELGENYFCSAYSSFFDYSYERLTHAAQIAAANSGL